MSGARVTGHLGINEATTHTILEEEARGSVRAATQAALTELKSETPVGTAAEGDMHPGRLAQSHRASVTRTAYGVQGRIRRSSDAWYGRIVEKGRKAGRGRTGRKVSAAKANPFVDRALDRVAPTAEHLLEEGGARAAARIESRVGGP